MNAKGMDISHHNGQIEWDQVPAEIEFVGIKATEGTGYVDPILAHNASAAKAKGKKTIAYHFFKPDQDAIAQAHHLLNTIAGMKFDYLALDVEDEEGAVQWESLDHDTRVAKISHFLEVVDPAGFGRCVIYCSPGWWNGVFGQADFSGHPLWVADYSRSPGSPRLCGQWDAFTIHQYSERGTVPGVGSGEVDVNVWNGPLPA